MLVSVSSIVFGRIEALALLAVAGVAFFAASRPGPRKVASVALLASIVVWSIMVSQALFYQGTPRTPIAVIVPSNTPVIGALTGGVYVYYEGVLYGLRQSLRALACLFTGAGLAASMSVLDIYTLLAGHRKLLVVLLAALRGLEKLLRELEESLASARLSGARLGLSRLHRLVPLVARRIESMSVSVALAMEYSTPVRVYSAWSTVAVLLLAATIALALLYTIYMLYSVGIVHDSWLHRLYEILRLWMA
ncbi:hypothetical protein Pyrde_1422 [Pyrodictium delaneyi]|uniref:Energy-coupling factor transporter transmembrane protein EcfT n=1 Tax=Pyrodictium delaneyi TaxID=1273541 RepID=A0A0P0N4R8_9CREN|nr:hypothetical protein Pyrde_1422 [Pyrodictium delaneyi]